MQVVKFVVIGVGDLFGRVAQVPWLGFAFALVLVVGGVLAIRSAGLRSLRGRYAVPGALLVGGVLFLALTGIVRSGQPALFATQINIGPGRAGRAGTSTSWLRWRSPRSASRSTRSCGAGG